MVILQIMQPLNKYHVMTTLTVLFVLFFFLYRWVLRHPYEEKIKEIRKDVPKRKTEHENY
jgi:uncharacterized membrane protein YjfL (UPF0719 family)